MKLIYAEIKNFRSIKSLRVEFSPSCRVLVGINESGKSNILMALSKLSKNEPVSKEDLRDPSPREGLYDKAYIDFIFELDKEEIQGVYKNIETKILAQNKNTPIFKKSQKKINLKTFCRSRNQGIYRVDLKAENKLAMYWTINDVKEYKILPNWKKISETCPDDYSLDVESEKKINLKSFDFVNIKDYKNIPAEYLEAFSINDVNDLIGIEMSKIIEEKLLEVIFWTYTEKNLLPPTVRLNDFSDNPDLCIPLKNMFILYGIENIKDEIEKTQQKHHNALPNLLNRIADHTTIYFRKVWKEYKKVKFDLSLNGGDIEIGIREKIGKEDGNKFHMAMRSDGFKRFVSFLLVISIKVESKKLNNALLLIDEPAISLHPSGASYLMNELVKISKNNYVIYSTHSIFMIDGENINRHYIVKKIHEITNLKAASVSNIRGEEVLFNALGHSVFSILKTKNIIFEGWQDKELFRVALKRVTPDYKDLKTFFSKIGYCYSRGVDIIANIASMLELAKRKCLIISDSDKRAREKQKRFFSMHGRGDWKRYDEILSKSNIVVTSEDFLREDIFKASIRRIKKKYQISTDPNLVDTKGKIYALRAWLNKNIEKKDVNDEIDKIKKNIFDNLKLSNIEPKYYNFLKKLKGTLARR